MTVAERLRITEIEPERTVRFVAFVNEEPPLFLMPAMDSRVYAAMASAGAITPHSGGRVIAPCLGRARLTWGSDVPAGRLRNRHFRYFYPARSLLQTSACHIRRLAWRSRTRSPYLRQSTSRTRARSSARCTGGGR